MPAAIAIKKLIVAKSPNGRILFPGVITASRIVMGTNRMPAVMTVESPRRMAGSIPINTDLPLNFRTANSLTRSWIGIKPSMMHLTTRGISSIKAPILTPHTSDSGTRNPASRPMIVPITNPSMDGSAKTPIFSCRVSAVRSISLSGLICSTAVSVKTAKGAIYALVPWGTVSPLIPKYSEMVSAHRSPIL